MSDDVNRGLYGKYLVFRTRDLGDPEFLIRAAREHRRAAPVDPCFVLNYARDPHALVALRAYADSCRGEYPELARDLDAMIEHIAAARS